MESKYGRLFTEADVERLLRAEHDRAFSAGMVEEGVGLEPDDPRARPLRLEDAEDEEIELTFPADEPLFLLRGQDRAASAALYTYYGTCLRHGAADAHLDAVLAAVDVLEDWQAGHPERVKVPD